MHAYRIEFQWKSALPGQETRERGFRASTGERLVFSREKYSRDALPAYRELIVSEATRAGMKDFRIKITAVVGVKLRQPATPKAASAAGVPAVSLH